MEYFVAVIDHGGITKAANALYIAQPSLSQAIRNLESEVGAQLFDRGGRRLELTAAGHRLEESARRVLRDAGLARDRVAAVRELRSARLQVAALADLTVDPMPRLVSRMRSLHPGVLVWVKDPGTPAGVTAAVRRGDAEIGLTTLPVKATALTTRALWTQRMVLAMTPDLAPAADPLPQENLRDLPLILEPDDRLAELLAEPALAPRADSVVVRCAHKQTIWELVMAGAGVELLPESIAASQLSGVVLRTTVPEIRRELGLVYRADQLSPAAEAFLAVAEQDSLAT
ncbi:MAG: LysR family transcriptional regulator, cyn operon transcriptional activator [Pseudonocardia sp.]|jgi:DNA-binding transcriptional LysR family regulator